MMNQENDDVIPVSTNNYKNNLITVNYTQQNIKSCCQNVIIEVKRYAIAYNLDRVKFSEVNSYVGVLPKLSDKPFLLVLIKRR